MDSPPYRPRPLSPEFATVKHAQEVLDLLFVRLHRGGKCGNAFSLPHGRKLYFNSTVSVHQLLSLASHLLSQSKGAGR
jgi:hypothetical protein